MKIQAMLDWSPEEKSAKVKEWTQSLFTLRLQKATGQLENPMKIKHLRKDLARLRTAQHMGAAQLAAAAAHEVAPAHTEGSEEKTSLKGKEAAGTAKPKGHAGASGKGAKKRAAAAKATGKKTAGAAGKAHSPSKKSSSSSSGAATKKAAAPKAKSATPKKSKKK
jgi:large subunit ribosomal protein L29